MMNRAIRRALAYANRKQGQPQTPQAAAPVPVRPSQPPITRQKDLPPDPTRSQHTQERKRFQDGGGTVDGHNPMSKKNLDKALDVALSATHPKRLHHTLARTGYAEGGIPDIQGPAELAGETPYTHGKTLASQFDVAKVQPYKAAKIAPGPVDVKLPKKSMVRAPRADIGKMRMHKPKMKKFKGFQFAKGGAAIEDALNLASRTMADMAKGIGREDGLHGASMQQGATSTIVKEKLPGKKSEVVYEHHAKTPVEREAFASGGRGPKKPEEKAPEEKFYPSNPGGALQRLYDMNKSGQIGPDTEFKHDPNDPTYNITPYEYHRGNLPFGRYALADGGRAELADGGDPMQQYAANLKATGMPQSQIDAIIGSQTHQAPTATAAPAVGSNPAAPVTAAPVTAAQPQAAAAAPVTAPAPATTAAPQPQVSDLLTKYFGASNQGIADYINKQIQSGTYTMPQVDAWLQTPEAKTWYTGATAPAATTQKSGAAPSLQTAAATQSTATTPAKATTPSVTSLSSLPAKSTVFIQGNPYYITTPEEAKTMKANGTLPSNYMYASGLQNLGINNLIATGSNDFGGTHYVAYTPQTAAQYGLTYSANPTASTAGGTTPTVTQADKATADYNAAMQNYQNQVNAYNFAKTQYDLYGNPAVLSMSVPVPPAKPTSSIDTTQQRQVTPQSISDYYRSITGVNLPLDQAKIIQQDINSGKYTADQLQNAWVNSFPAADYTKYQIENSYNSAFGGNLTKDQLNSVYSDIQNGKYNLSQLQNAWINSQPAQDNYRQQYAQDAMGRKLTPEELTAWQNYVGTGPDAASKNQQIEQAIANSPETQNYENTQYVSSIYNSLTGRDPKPDELAKVLPDLNSGKLSINDLVKNVQNTEEAKDYGANTAAPFDVARKGLMGEITAPSVVYPSFNTPSSDAVNNALGGLGKYNSLGNVGDYNISYVGDKIQNAPDKNFPVGKLLSLPTTQKAIDNTFGSGEKGRNFDWTNSVALTRALQQIGIPEQAALAIAGNAGVESAAGQYGQQLWDVKEAGGRGPGVGTLQFTYPARKNAFLKIASQNGGENSLSGNVAVISNEMKNPEYAAMIKAAANAPDLATATAIVAKYYENPKASALIESMPRRIAFAKELQPMYQSYSKENPYKPPPPPPPAPFMVDPNAVVQKNPNSISEALAGQGAGGNVAGTVPGLGSGTQTSLKPGQTFTDMPSSSLTPLGEVRDIYGYPVPATNIPTYTQQPVPNIGVGAGASGNAALQQLLGSQQAAYNQQFSPTPNATPNYGQAFQTGGSQRFDLGMEARGWTKDASGTWSPPPWAGDTVGSGGNTLSYVGGNRGGRMTGNEEALRIADHYANGGGAWTRKEGKNPKGGLNAKGRASLRAQGHDIRPPAPHPKTEKDAARRKSFCARMSGMPGPMKDDNGKPTRKALSLRAWNCRADGGMIDDALRLARSKVKE